MFKLPGIPKSPEKQITQLEDAVGELFEWLMSELWWDNPGSIADRLDDRVNKIAHRGYERYCERQQS